jgi:hypothetical protein
VELKLIIYKKKNGILGAAHHVKLKSRVRPHKTSEMVREFDMPGLG